jgi:hypothetical protein
MESKVSLIVLSLVALFSVNACQSLTTSDQALQSSREKTSLAADGNRMSNNEPQSKHRLQIKLYPIDEGQRDTSFVDFRNRLLKAAREHDAAFILSVLHPRIINSSDGEGGVREFKHQWKLDRLDSRLWETLTTVVSMGGSFRINDGHKEFCAPYVTSQWPSVVSQLPKSADPLDYAVITGKDVAVRTAPNPTASLVTTLSYDVVKVHAEGSPANASFWMKITTLNGEEGYVLDKNVRSAGDYQACFEKVGEQWMMTELASRE